MANKDVQSKYTLKFEQQGAERVQKHVNKLKASLEDAGAGALTRGAAEGQGRLLRQVAGFSRHLHNATKALDRLAKVANRLAGSMGSGGGGGAGGDSGDGGSGESSRGSSDRGRQGFTQGFLQGIGFGPYLERGPGMYRQAAGMAAGGFAQGIASMPYAGLSGLAQGLRSIPGGGLIGAGLQTAISGAGSQLQFQRAMLALGGQDPASQRAEALYRARVAAARQVTQPLASPTVDAAGVQLSGLMTDTGASAPDLGAVQTSVTQTRQQVTQRRAAIGRAQRIRMGSSPQRQFDRDVRDLSVMTRTEGLQFAQQAGLSNIDATFAAAQRGGGMREALAAQTLGLGDAATFGGFFRGQRRGGIVGTTAQNAGIQTAIENAMRSGLDRSEVNDFLSTIAQAQKSFESTGIPINPGSLMDLGRGLVGVGGAGARATAIASGFGQAAERISLQGPQTAGEFLALQSLGGFRGGGLRGLLDAQERLERKEFGAAEILDFVRRGSAGAGGGEAGQVGLRSELSRLGIRLGVGETRRLQAIATGGGMSAEDEAFVQQQLAAIKGAGTPDLQERAKAAIRSAPGLKRQQDLENRRIDLGNKMLASVQTMEKAQTETAKAVSEFAPLIQAAATAAYDVAAVLPKLTGAMTKFLLNTGAAKPTGGPG